MACSVQSDWSCRVGDRWAHQDEAAQRASFVRPYPREDSCRHLGGALLIVAFCPRDLDPRRDEAIDAVPGLSWLQASLEPNLGPVRDVEPAGLFVLAAVDKESQALLPAAGSVERRPRVVVRRDPFCREVSPSRGIRLASHRDAGQGSTARCSVDLASRGMAS